MSPLLILSFVLYLIVCGFLWVAFFTALSLFIFCLLTKRRPTTFQVMAVFGSIGLFSALLALYVYDLSATSSSWQDLATLCLTLTSGVLFSFLYSRVK